MKASIKYALAAAVVSLLALPSVGRAQAPDLSGTWTFDAAKSTGRPEPVSLAGGESPEVAEDGRVGGGGGGGGRAGAAAAAAGGQPAGGRAARPVDFFKLVIKQTPKDINLLEGGVALMFKLDGTQDSISALGRAGYPKGKGVWEGNKLVLTTTQDVYIGKAQFAPRNTRDVYSLEGGVLTIEKTETFQTDVKKAKLVYTKSTT